MSRPIKTKCIHCGGKASIIPNSHQVLKDGGVSQVVCSNCSAIDSVKIIHNQRHQLPPDKTKRFALVCVHCGGYCTIKKTHPELITKGDIKVALCTKCGSTDSYIIEHQANLSPSVAKVQLAEET